MAVSLGPLDGTQFDRPLFKDDRFELTGEGAYDLVNLPLPYTGLNIGSGAATKHPAGLYDGLFLSLADITGRTNYNQDTNVVKTSIPSVTYYNLGEDLGFGRRLGTEFYDFAEDASKVVYCVFTAKYPETAGMENTVHNYNTLTDPFAPNHTSGQAPEFANTWDPGRRDADACSGLTGSFQAWITTKHTNEMDLTNYAPGVELTVAKGRTLILPTITSGTYFVVGKVKKKVTVGTVTKVLVQFALDNPYKVIVP